MAYHMNIMLTDAEYQALAQEATKCGKRLELVAREILIQHMKPLPPDAHQFSKKELEKRELEEFLYNEGIAMNIPTGEPDTPEEAVERERLRHLFSQGQPLSEMIIEDRGPY